MESRKTFLLFFLMRCCCENRQLWTGSCEFPRMFTAWQDAKAPNYDDNEDKHYAYSELPYLGEYQLIQLPSDGKLVDHVDYWGEGRVDANDGVSGFKDAFNVNYQFQLVSRGKDERRRIPNRIPTEDVNSCNTNRYIKDNSVRTVTIPASKLACPCINDIYRIINSESGFIIVYFNNDEEIKEIAHLERLLIEKNIFEVPGWSLTGKFSEITYYSSSKVFLSLSNSYEKLLEDVNKGDYYASVRLLRRLHDAKQGALITTVIDRLLIECNPHTTDLAYLCFTTSTELFEKYFAHIYKLIFTKSPVKLVSNNYNLAIKLDVNLDRYNDRLAWGHGLEGENDRLNWKFIPVYENNLVSFRLMNVKTDMYLKLDVNSDFIGDREAWGSALSGAQRYLWKLEPVKVNDKILFFIINKHFGQGLKMAESTDRYNDRVVWGSSASVKNEPLKYGWSIPAWTS